MERIPEGTLGVPSDAKEFRRRYPGTWQWIREHLDKDNPPVEPESRAMWLMVAEAEYASRQRAGGFVLRLSMNAVSGLMMAVGVGGALHDPATLKWWAMIGGGGLLLVLLNLDPFRMRERDERLREKIEAVRATGTADDGD